MAVLPGMLAGGCEKVTGRAAWEAESRAGAEAMVRDVAEESAKAVATKDLEKTAGSYAEDAVLYPAGEPAVVSGAAIRKWWGAVLQSPGLQVSVQVVKVQAAKSGELAYETGTYQMSSLDKNGKRSGKTGRYLRVWKGQGDQSWKAVVEMLTEDNKP